MQNKITNSLLLLLLGVQILTQIGTATADGRRYNTEESLGNFMLMPTKEEAIQGHKYANLPKNVSVPKEWARYINPTFEHFWREGNHLPDKGYILLYKKMASLPKSLSSKKRKSILKEYAKLLLIRSDIKERMIREGHQITLEAYQDLTRGKVIRDALTLKKSAPKRKGQKKPLVTLKDTENLDYFFIFSRGCKYCDQFAPIISKFNNVYPLQMNEPENLKEWDGMNPTEVLSHKIKSDYNITATPTLIIVNSKNNQSIILTGLKTYNEVLKASSKLLQ